MSDTGTKPHPKWSLVTYANGVMYAGFILIHFVLTTSVAIGLGQILLCFRVISSELEKYFFMVSYMSVYTGNLLIL